MQAIPVLVLCTCEQKATSTSNLCIPHYCTEKAVAWLGGMDCEAVSLAI